MEQVIVYNWLVLSRSVSIFLLWDILVFKTESISHEEIIYIEF